MPFVHKATRALRDLIMHRRLSHWHPISTAPYNRDLELRVFEEAGAGETILPFPCRHSNSGAWLNADLGIRIQAKPVSWRVWQ